MVLNGCYFYFYAGMGEVWRWCWWRYRGLCDARGHRAAGTRQTRDRADRKRSSESTVSAVDYNQAAKTVRNYAPPEPEIRRRRPPACAASHPRFLQTTTALLLLPPLSPRSERRGCGKNWAGAYLNTFQLFRGSRSEIIETMVDWLGSTGRGRGCGRKRSKEKAAQRL